ncbi:MAG: hypothetical protein ACLR0U_06780 [Enterocloster clostridioformis]
MHLYFHTNTEMALYYIKALLRDGDEHPMSEIYDYVMENCKGHAVMGEPMRATVISFGALAAGEYGWKRLLPSAKRCIRWGIRRNHEGDAVPL